MSEHPDAVILADDTSEQLKNERSRKYWMKALGGNYGESRLVGYQREGASQEVVFSGGLIYLTNEESAPPAFSSRVSVIKHDPTQEQLHAVMLHLATAGCPERKMNSRECLEVTEFLISEMIERNEPCDLRDQSQHAYGDYCLWRSGGSLLHWKDLIRSHLDQKRMLREAKSKSASPVGPGVRESRLEEERGRVRWILGLYDKRSDQLSMWRHIYPDYPAIRFDRRKREVLSDCQ
jgi:hypothetical protein